MVTSALDLDSSLVMRLHTAGTLSVWRPVAGGVLPCLIRPSLLRSCQVAYRLVSQLKIYCMTALILSADTILQVQSALLIKKCLRTAKVYVIAQLVISNRVSTLTAHMRYGTA